MSAVTLPPAVPPVPAMTSTPEGAQDLATDLRATTVAVKNVQADAASAACPGWSGDAALGNDHAATVFARRLDVVEAALDRAVTAVDRFGERLVELFTRRGGLVEERAALATELDSLRREVATATDDSRAVEHQERADRLGARGAAILTAIEAWVTACADAEDDLVRALRAVDSLPEGRGVVQEGSRPDVDALAGRLRALLDDHAALAAWWRHLGRAEQEALTTEHPELVGNAHGLPASDRDEANRAAIAHDTDHHTAGTVHANAVHVADALDRYADLLDVATGEESTRVLAYQPGLHSGDGGVAISFGDPDSADHVSISVPGLSTDSSSTTGNLTKAHALHLAALAEARGSVATIYWGDYDAPSGQPLNPLDPLGQLDAGGVVFGNKAEAGAGRLDDFVAGLHAADRGAPAHLTAIGHSYGSTTLGHALVGGLVVDDAVLLGSPGVPAPTADALTAADVWVGAKDHDPVTLLGLGSGGPGALGFDPADADFDAHRFETGDGDLRVEDLIDNHTSYFAGESLANLAHVVADADTDVTAAPGRGDAGGGHLSLSQLLAAASAVSATERAEDAGQWVLDHLAHGGRWPR